MSKGYTGSKTPEAIRDLWRTPQEVFDYYNKRFNFTLDMASSRENKLCEWWIDSSMNALSDETMGETIAYLNGEEVNVSVWCNPPYSDCKSWVTTVISYAKSYRVPFVMLLPSDTSVKWFKLAFNNCTECHFISGRLAFINEETGKPVSGNNKGSVVFVFDPHSPVKQSVSLIDRDVMMGG